MANTLTNVLPVLTTAAQVVSREAVGFLRAIDLRGSAEPVALNQTLNIPRNPTMASTTYAPSLSPSLTDRTITGLQLTLSTAKECAWHITAEQARGMDTGNSNAMADFSRQSQQAMRTLANEVEAYIAGLARNGASRAVGTAGTTPFASNLTAASTVAQVLNENGAPMQGRSLVCSTGAYANLQAQFANVTTTRDNASFEAGEIPGISGLIPRLSVQPTAVTKGTGTSYVTSGSTAVGVTDIALVTGSGTVLAGDVVTFAADTTNKYVVNTGVSAPGTITIGRPGARVVIATSNAMTVGNTYTANTALTRDSILCVVRPPAQPVGSPYIMNDVVVDAVSGIPFGVTSIIGDGVVYYSVRIVYGGIVVEPAHIATLMG